MFLIRVGSADFADAGAAVNGIMARTTFSAFRLSLFVLIVAFIVRTKAKEKRAGRGHNNNGLVIVNAFRGRVYRTCWALLTFAIRVAGKDAIFP